MIIGASGFIGRSLLELYGNDRKYNIYVLLRNVESIAALGVKNVKIIQGDLTNEKSLDALIQPGATVINLAFLEESDRLTNLNAMSTLVNKCKSIGIKRFLHCSTSSVYGRIKDKYVTEETKCNPKSVYEKTKLEIEKLLIREATTFDLIIVRPTSVFGKNGKNLIKFVENVKTGNPILNYIRASFYWKRRMNLVSVETVASSIKYLSESKKLNGVETFIVSEDDVGRNNFYDIEKCIRKYLGVNNYKIPVCPIPYVVLRAILWLFNRSSSNPNTIYSNQKLANFGFEKTKPFIEALEHYVDGQRDNTH